MGIDLATWRTRIGLNYYHMHVSPRPDQVEEQWWSAVPAWGGQLGGGGVRE